MIITEARQIEEAAQAAKRVAVLGIKPETHPDAPAHYVPARVAGDGVTIVPVPVYYPEVEVILGEAVVRDLTRVGQVDMVCVFRRPQDLAQHIDDLKTLAPPLVWLQQGIEDEAFATAMTEAGIDVVQNRCLMVERFR